MKQEAAIRWAAAVMLVGIGLGAFGAHGFEEILERNGRVDIWNTAVKYHLVHGVALFAVALYGIGTRNLAFWCWLAGILLFSGSLYVLALTNQGKLGAVTPFGGVLFMVGWGALLLKPGAGSD